MIKLTEEMVIARTRISDLSNVKKLNCWGADLQDVSLLRQMPNVEVLALSVNQIQTLVDFQNCHQLQELYIRKNNIKDLRDVCYLKGLSNLKNLWLADNPCSQEDCYRFTVLRALPQLEKLDDMPVKPEELQEAGRKGRDLVLPVGEESSDSHESTSSISELITIDSSTYKEKRKSPETASVSPSFSSKSSPIALSPDFLDQNQLQATTVPEEFIVTQETQPDDPYHQRRFSVIGTGVPYQQEKSVHSESAPASRRSSVAVSSFNSGPEHSSVNTLIYPNEPPSPSKCPIHQNNFTPVQSTHVPLPQSTSSSQPDLRSVPISNDLRNSFVADQRPYRVAQDPQPRNSQLNYPSSSYLMQSQTTPSYVTTPPGQNPERCSPTRSGGRVRNRTSNLLMAALCLINELDYGSLEVLGMAVRNRLDELDSN